MFFYKYCRINTKAGTQFGESWDFDKLTGQLRSILGMTVPIKTLLLSIAGQNCTGDGEDSIFCIASTAIALGSIVLGCLEDEIRHELAFIYTRNSNTSDNQCK